jgi:hypothetical protein
MAAESVYHVVGLGGGQKRAHLPGRFYFLTGQFGHLVELSSPLGDPLKVLVGNEWMALNNGRHEMAS